MKRYKLLLLGGIFTLFGLFNYSSAVNQTITMSCRSFSCSPNSITFPSNLTSRSDISMSYSNLSLNDEFGSAYFQVNGDSDKYFEFVAFKQDDHSFCEGDLEFCQTDCEEHADDMNWCLNYCQLEYQNCMLDYLGSFEGFGDFGSNVSYVYNGGFPGTVDLSFTFDDGQSSGGGNEGGNEGGVGSGLIGQLTPIITGLDNVIIEFIPYVVYVGLCVLGVLIGFFTIKRLINWVRGNTLSIFNSRRKRK